ncbi:MAG TPA: hypothetical protein VFF39_07810 [Verrucomicrobiae bacterium]|nr:hypothetical protein [Verrucomicrobiae bacterium]
MKEQRTKYGGNRPFIIAFVNAPLQSSELSNIFGSHEAAQGLAVVTLHSSTQYVREAKRYCSYYLTRYALSFANPLVRAHDDPARMLLLADSVQGTLSLSRWIGEISGRKHLLAISSTRPRTFDPDKKIVSHVLKKQIRNCADAASALLADDFVEFGSHWEKSAIPALDEALGDSNLEMRAAALRSLEKLEGKE